MVRPSIAELESFDFYCSTANCRKKKFLLQRLQIVSTAFSQSVFITAQLQFICAYLGSDTPIF